MSYVLTLVASSQKTPVTEAHFREINDVIKFYNTSFNSKIVWLRKNKAAEVAISSGPQSSLTSHLRELLHEDQIDFFITRNEDRQKKLLVADMDSTIVSSETLDEIAEHAGIKEQIAEITIRAMEGKIDFHDALKERVGLLKGLEANALNETLEKTSLNPGAKTLVKSMKQAGAKCVLVSGGFTFFTEAIAEQCGFDAHHGNILEIKDNALTGQVTPPILDKFSKVEFLNQYLSEQEIDKDNSLTIGDGANDLPMLKMAGIGIGYHPKEAVKSELHNCILYGDLTAALYAQGFSEKMIVNE